MLSVSELRAAYDALRQSEPHLYLRDAAERLGVSEMQLLRLDAGGQVIRLRPDIPALLEALPTLGPLKALSRNQWVVIETIGTYPAPYTERGAAIFNSSTIDLRIYLSVWRHAFAVRSFAKDGRPLYSLQFFSPWGEALHKVYLTAAEQVARWEALIAQYRHDDQTPEAETIAPFPQPTEHSPLPPDKTEDFLRGWDSLTDTHEFFALLRRFGIDRLSAVKVAEGRHTWRLAPSTIHELLEWARESQTPIMFFVGNGGIHHIYTGTIRMVSPARGWLNVLDPDFNLHIDPAGIYEVYLVRKPTQEGDIYSVEVFGPNGEEVLWIFGARKPGQTVPEAWLKYIQSLRAAVA